MADPISLGVMAVASVASSIMSASQQQQQAAQQASMLQQQAQQVQNASALQDQQIRIRADQTMGQQLARAGGAGVDTNSGSILTDVGETQANAARDIFSNDYTAESRSANLYTSASNITANAATGFNNALIGGGLKLASLGAGPLYNAFGGASYVGDPSATSAYGSARPMYTGGFGTGYQGGGV